MKIDVYNQSGKVVDSMDLSPAMFAVEMNSELLHQAVVRQNANARQATAKAKTKGEVRGGGKKPFKQKGTGRARAGSTRSPLWIGGGVVFGPTGNENYTRSINKKESRKALFMALSDKAAAKKTIALDTFESANAKTKDAQAMINALPVERNVLVVATKDQSVLKRTVQNIPNVKFVLPGYVNVVDVLKYDMVMFTKDALAQFEETFSTNKK